MTSVEVLKKLETIYNIFKKQNEYEKTLILIEGDWGIGKTYSHEFFVKKMK